MTETELIETLTRDLPVNEQTLVGAGDDCAAVRGVGSDASLLLKVDAVVEGVHFTRDDAAEQVGHKALARCLSDIAAMGGEPDSALITVGLPDLEVADYLRGVYQGLRATAARYGVAVLGGETVRNPGGLLLSVSVTGKAPAGGAILRSGAQEGDAIFVTGDLGASILGKHLTFEPRLAEARWLAAEGCVHAMIDLSDGLASDLGHVLHASGMGAQIDEAYLPISRAARVRAREDAAAKPPLMAALTDGEDFELLFTVAAGAAVGLKDAWREAFPETKLSLIGRIQAEKGCRLKTANGMRSLDGIHGYDHFA